MADVNTVSNEQFENDLKDASAEHLTAFFNPMEDARKEAELRIRAASGWSPSAWEKFDAAAGTSTERQTVEAASMGYRMGVNFDASEALDEQFVESTVMDTLAGSGFGISASLADYVYARPLKSGRMEATTAMNYRSESRQDLDTNGLDGVPLPVNLVTWEIDGREMESKRAYGEDPEARPAREARRAINRREHEILYNGWGGDFDTEAGVFSIGGLDTTDDSKAIQVGESDGWQDGTVLLNDMDTVATALEQQEDVTDEDDLPLMSDVGALVFVPKQKWGTVSRDNYETEATDEPVTDRLNRKYPYVQFVPAPRLDSDTAIVLLNDPRYFGVVNAQGMTNTAWDIDGGAARSFRILSSRIPWVRRQPDGIKGIARLTGI